MNIANYKIGDRFGTLVVSEDMGNGYWYCKCDCGKDGIYSSSELKNRKYCSKTCKLFNHVYAHPVYKKHGDRSGGKRSRLYRIWDGMIARCTRESQSGYERYGGRRITVCDEWRSYEVFKEWAINNGYRDDLTIDRIDNDGNYEPLNCRWATYKQQAINRSSRKCAVCNIDGIKISVRELAKRLDTPVATIYQRIEKYGKDSMEILFYKKKPRNVINKV